MKVRKAIVAPFLAVALIGSVTACGERQELRACTEYEDETLDLDDEGECEGNDEEEGGEESESDKRKKKRSGKRR